MKKVVKNLKALREKSLPVQNVEEAKHIISELKKSLVPLPTGVGLGAIQIGIPKRIAVIRRNGGFLVLINPELIDTDEEFTFFNEGCLSIPNQSKNTQRYRHIQIKNHYIDGNELKEEQLYFYHGQKGEINSDGLVPIAIQHEIDHMNGKLILDFNASPTGIINDIQPIISSTKVGRNDPCPCGSGKKYKKCCI